MKLGPRWRQDFLLAFILKTLSSYFCTLTKLLGWNWFSRCNNFLYHKRMILLKWFLERFWVLRCNTFFTSRENDTAENDFLWETLEKSRFRFCFEFWMFEYDIVLFVFDLRKLCVETGVLANFFSHKESSYIFY